MTYAAPAAPPRRRAVAAVLVAGAVFAAACGAGRPQGAVRGTTTTTTIGPVRTVRIGLLGSGRGSDLAVDDGARLALNPPSGGADGTDLVVTTMVTGGTEAGAAAAARRMVTDHVAAVIGPGTTAEVLGAEPVLSAAGIPSLTVTTTSSAFPEAGWSGFFRNVADTAQQGILVIDHLVRSLGATSVAIVSSVDPGDRSLAAAARSEVGVDGATVVERTDRATSATLGAIARSVLVSGATGVVAAIPPALDAVLVEALTSVGFQGVTVLTTQGSPLTLALAAADGGGRTYVASPADDLAIAADPTGAALVFDDSYRGAFGTGPRAWAAQAYDAATIMLHAVASGATRPADIQAYLGANSLPGVAGPVSFAASGDVADPAVWLSQSRDGGLVQVGRQT